MNEESPAFVPAPPVAVHFMKRFGFSFLLLYLLLYGLPFPIGQISAQEDTWPVESAAKAVTEWFGNDAKDLPHAVTYPAKWYKEYSEELQAYVGWFGESVLGSMFDIGEVKHARSSSGDTLFDWVRVAMLLTIALLIAPLLALILRGRRTLDGCNRVVRVYTRYALASTLCVYGFAKLFPLQFPPLSGEEFYSTYGDATPMNMLWTFMRASEPYVMLSGIAEALAGVLLLFRRTTTLGALVSLFVMINVTLLNFCYDVPVKLFSAHMVLFAAFLLVGDRQRLWSIFFSQRAMPARQLRPAMPKWLLILWFTFKLAAIGCVVGVPLVSSYNMWHQQQTRELGLLEGIWEAREFSWNAADGSATPPAEHWHHLTIQYSSFGGQTRSFATIRKLGGRKIASVITVDPTTKTMRLPRRNQAALEFRFEERSQLVEGQEVPIRQLVLTGTVDGRDLRTVLDFRDESTFRLKRTGFRWVQEYPINRNAK